MLVLSCLLCSPPHQRGCGRGTTVGTVGLGLYFHGFLGPDLMQLVRQTLLSFEVYSHIFYSRRFLFLIITTWLSSFYLLYYMGMILYVKPWPRLEER